MRFVIHTPPWDQLSGGQNLLWVLGRKLYEKGYDASMWVENMSNQDKNTIFRRYTTDVGFDESTIVVYSEMIVGNPLKAKKIMRWVLYGAHMYDQFEPNEIVYYLAPFCQNNFPKQILQGWYVPPNIALPTEPRTEESCFILKKGHRNPWPRNRFYANPPSGFDMAMCWDHNHVIETFKKTKYFHCYDPACFLIVIALMCGCIVIQHPYVEGQTREQWEHAAYYGVVGKIKGLAYGIEDLPYAEATIHEAPEHCKKFLEFSESTVDHFVNDMESGTYNTDPCYKFNDSPYAYQHVTKM
jgi:hypothetical protein